MCVCVWGGGGGGSAHPPPFVEGVGTKYFHTGGVKAVCTIE